MMRPNDDDIAYGIEISGVYDGVAVWVLKDGTMVNRFAGEPGYERRAARIQEYIDFNRSTQEKATPEEE
jgi:hypothetical protein